MGERRCTQPPIRGFRFDSCGKRIGRGRGPVLGLATGPRSPNSGNCKNRDGGPIAGPSHWPVTASGGLPVGPRPGRKTLRSSGRRRGRQGEPRSMSSARSTDHGPGRGLIHRLVVTVRNPGEVSPRDYFTGQWQCPRGTRVGLYVSVTGRPNWRLRRGWDSDRESRRRIATALERRSRVPPLHTGNGNDADRVDLW